MLLATDECLSCTACATRNIAGRATCWRCGAPLSDLRSLRHTPAPAPWTDIEFNSLLSQAVLIDFTKPRRPAAAKRASAARIATPVKIQTQAGKRTAAPLTLSGAGIRAATTLSFTLFSIVTAPGPCESSGSESAPPHRAVASSAFAAPAAPPRHAAKASPSLLARRQIAPARPTLSLDEETQKIQADLNARTRQYLTTGLNMVRDYEAAHGPVTPLPDSSRHKPNAPYSDYIARMKFTLMQEGVI